MKVACVLPESYAGLISRVGLAR